MMEQLFMLCVTPKMVRSYASRSLPIWWYREVRELEDEGVRHSSCDDARHHHSRPVHFNVLGRLRRKDQSVKLIVTITLVRKYYHPLFGW